MNKRPFGSGDLYAPLFLPPSQLVALLGLWGTPNFSDRELAAVSSTSNPPQLYAWPS
jgi:hypothetical protein